VVSRDRLTTEAAQARLAAQTPLEAKLAVASYVVHNDAGLAELKAQVTKLHETLCQRFVVSEANLSSEKPS
jgi:dephospho-CoA kinase